MAARKQALHMLNALLVLAGTRPYDLTDLDVKIQEGIDSADHGDLFTEEEARAYLAAVRRLSPRTRSDRE